MKIGKSTLIFYIVTALVLLADMALAGVALYYYIGQAVGTVFLPPFFTGLCAAMIAINGAELVFAGVYVWKMKK